MSTTSSSAAPTRRARIIAMSRAWRRLLAGLGDSAPGTTINRLCGSGLDAVAMAARAIKAGEAELIVAGGVESMTRAPFVMPKADRRLQPRQRHLRHDHRLALRQQAAEGRVRRSIRCPRRPKMSPTSSRSAARTRTGSPRPASTAPPPRRPMAASPPKSSPVTIPQRKGDPIIVDRDEHPRADQRRDAWRS